MRVMGAVGVVGVMALAGCDGSALDTVSDRYDEATEAYNDLVEDVDPLVRSSDAQMATVTGTATYEGYASLFMDTDTDTAEPATVLVGEATIDADFGDGTLSGGIDNWLGSVDGGVVRTVGGQIDITGGTIGGGLSAADAEATLAGTLTAGGREIEVDGFLDGSFLTEDGQAAGAFEAEDRTGTEFLFDGTAVEGELYVVGRR